MPGFHLGLCAKRGRCHGPRPNDVIGQLLRVGLETIEAGKAEGLKAQKVLAEVRAVV
jgi:hypothetical protein